MTQDRRAVPRLSVDLPAVAAFEGASIACRVKDISAAGASIAIDHSDRLPARFQLMLLDDGRLFACRVVWISRGRAGVAFEGEGEG